MLAREARNTAMFYAEQDVKPAVPLRDNDGKFGPEFDAVFAAEGVAVQRALADALRERGIALVELLLDLVKDALFIFTEWHGQPLASVAPWRPNPHLGTRSRARQRVPRCLYVRVYGACGRFPSASSSGPHCWWPRRVNLRPLTPTRRV